MDVIFYYHLMKDLRIYNASVICTIFYDKFDDVMGKTRLIPLLLESIPHIDGMFVIDKVKLLGIEQNGD